MNKQTKSLRQNNMSAKVGKGIDLMQDGAEKSGALTFQKFDSTKGRCVNSSKEREAQGRKPFMGALKQRPRSLGEVVED